MRRNMLYGCSAALLGAWAVVAGACAAENAEGAGQAISTPTATAAQSAAASAPTAAPQAAIPPFACGCDQDASPVLDPRRVPVDVSLNAINVCEQRSCQSCFDCFGWQLFVGMSWPAGARGAPDPSKPFGAPGDLSPLVWETYADGHAIFDKGNDTLPPWDAPPSEKLLTSTSLRAKLQADHNWLTDKDGNLVRYEIRINRDLYDYIRDNKLNTKAGLLAAFRGPGFKMPSGAEGGVGTIEVKAAWREVPAGRLDEFKARYKLSKAKIDGVDKIVALIGLHIAKKTPKLHQWAWATFEHESNAPAEGAAPGPGPYNLYNPALPADYKPNYDVPPGRMAPPAPSSKPVQVRRAVPMGPSAERLNAYMQGLIAERFPQSVFRHYKLVDVQWPMKPEPVVPKPTEPPPDGDPRPKIVANITMETYMQRKDTGGGAGLGKGATSVDPNDRGKSSCIACHRMSSVTPPFAQPAQPNAYWHTDYSALFFNAK